MKSQASSNEMRTIIRDNFKKFWTVPALGLFWLLVWGFLPIILSHKGHKATLDAMTAFSLNENFGYVLGILILAVGSGMTVFSYLQNPGASNYIHSLPINRGKLFAANVISGGLMILGPLVVNCVLMSLLAGNAIFLKWFVVTAISCFVIYAITIFAAMVSGNTLTHLFNAGFFNFVLSMIMLVIYAVLNDLLLGYEPSENWITALLNSNGLTAFIGEGESRVWMCVIYLVVGIVALFIGWTLYRRRPIERTGSSVVFSWVRTVLFLLCISCGAILSGILFGDVMNDGGALAVDYKMIIGMAAGALIVYVIGSLMIDRSARIFTKRNLLPAAIALALAFAVTGGIGADVFGYSKTIPDANDVKTVYVETANDVLFTSYDKEGSGYSFRGDGFFFKDSAAKTVKIGGNKVLGMTSDEAIQAARDLHQSLIDQDRSEGSSIGSVGIVYELKNGKQLRRSFQIYVTESEVNSIADYDPRITEAAEAFYNCPEFKQVYSLYNLKTEFLEKSTVLYWPNVYDGDDFYTIPRKDVKSLIDALEQDFQDSKYGDSTKFEGSIDIIVPGEKEDEENTLSIPIKKTDVHMKEWINTHQDILK